MTALTDQQDAQRATDALDEIGRAVAALLGGSWALGARDYISWPAEGSISIPADESGLVVRLTVAYADWRRHRAPTEQRLVIRADSSHLTKPGSRIGSFGDVMTSDEAYPEITVTAAKTPERITADIQRRILPQARELSRRIVERTLAESDRLATTASAAKSLHEILAGAIGVGHARLTLPRSEYHHRDTAHITAWTGTNYSGSRIEIEVDTDAEIKIRCSLDQARQIVATFSKFRSAA